MKPKTMILMVVAIGCGLVASVMTSRLIAERDAGEPQERRVKVIVPKSKIKAFELIKDPEKFFVEKEMPESAVPKNALRTFDEVKDKRPLKSLPEDALVLPDDLANKDLNGLSATLLPGSRAVAIRVSPECLAGGFVLPNSRVDVLHTLRRNGEESVTSTILQNMLVVAVDMNPTSDPERQAMLGNTVTLSARPEEAQRLTLASLTGELRLVLRPLGEDKAVTIRGSKVPDLTRPLSEDEGLLTTEKAPDEPTNLASLIPPLPPLPVAPEVEEPVTPAPIPVVVAPPEPVIKKHTLTLVQGTQVELVTFHKGNKTEPTPAPTPEKEAVPDSEPAPARMGEDEVEANRLASPVTGSPRGSRD